MRRGKAMAAHRCVWLVVVLHFSWTVSASADRIVLRNLDILSGKTVTGFDVDGVRLEDGTTIAWDRIEKGSVSAEQQVAFDKMLGELGSHLYRIRHRLSISDYRGLLPLAEAVHASYAGRRSETAYMVFQALMWSRLAAGQREAALQPYLECVECLRQAAAEGRTLSLPGPRQLQVDLATGLSSELPPVWFDAEAARQQLAAVGETIAGWGAASAPATRIYYATLALAAGETDKAVEAVAAAEGLPAWQTIVEAQTHISRSEADLAIQLLQRHWDQFTGDLQPLALYWLGQARLASADQALRQQGLLDLLRIAAVHGPQQPELAAAALDLAMHTVAQLGDMKGSIAIRRELLDRYGQTWHAERLRQQDTKAK